jgi:hypothetical protein
MYEHEIAENPHAGPDGGAPPPAAELLAAGERAVAELDQRLRELARERPFLAVGLALGAGFVLARLLARR